MKFRKSVSALALGVALCSSLPAAAQTNPVRRVIVFGDSLSDAGYYRNLVPGAGRFTTNPDLVTPEIVARLLGLQASSNYGLGGTNYATGGARVTAPNSASIPITTQINNFLNAGGTFRPDDIIYIQGGANDVFFYQATGSTDPAILTAAANQLAQQVARIQAAGGERIVTMNIPAAAGAGTALFNQTYGQALASAGVNALFFDANRLLGEIISNPGAYGITNITSTACLGSSLTCTPATYREPNANRTYLLADSVHPTGIAQQIQAEAITSLIIAPEQIGQLSFSAQSIGRSHRGMIEGAMRGAPAGDETSGVRLFGNVGYNNFSNEGSEQRVGLRERTIALQAGVDAALAGGAGVGVAVAYSDGEGDFDGSLGGYDVRAWSVTGYGRAAFGPLRVQGSATYGRMDYDDITRNISLGPALRTHSGSTQGDYFAASGAVSFLPLAAAGIRFGPEAGLSYERVEIDGYSENSSLSTGAVFGGQELESLTGRIGLVAVTSLAERLRISARASYEHDFSSEDRLFTITPTGAPISWTSRLGRVDDDYGSYAVTIEGDVTPGITARAGVRGYVERTDFDSFTGYVGVSVGF